MDLRTTTTALLRRSGLMPAANRLSNARYRVLKAFSRLAGGNPLEAVYTPAYFDAETRMTEPTADRVVGTLIEIFHPASVADVGCGTAVYLKAFLTRGVAVRGVEGSRHAIARALVDPALIRRADLAEPLTGEGRHDLALCFEVAEHLPPAAAGTLVESLCRLSDTVVFSAAPPGQGGADHLNEQPPAYWAERFAGRGYRLDAETTGRLRDGWRGAGCVWWLPVNTQVFRSAGPPAERPDRTPNPDD